ncbi:MAG: HEPN domain-containing protein [Rhodocyclaceae bacterium]
MNAPDDQAVELFAAARRDRVTYRILRRDAEAPIETTMFHAQQVAEKVIKAVLVQHGVVFRRTHDLIELLDLAGAHSIEVPVIRDLLLRLGPYAVEFRYLGVRAPEIGAEEADKAVASLMAWVSTVLGISE